VFGAAGGEWKGGEVSFNMSMSMESKSALPSHQTVVVNGEISPELYEAQ